MSKLFISGSGKLCKPMHERIKGSATVINPCGEWVHVGDSYVIGMGGFKDDTQKAKEFDNNTIVFVDEFLTRKP